jgi:hypothetical protein
MRNLFFLIVWLVTSATNKLYAQQEPVLIIDGQSLFFKAGVSFPYWLKAGQTINVGPNVKFVSILEFNIDSSNLSFVQTISLSSLQTVPASMTWKIESVSMPWALNEGTGFSNINKPSIFDSPRTYSDAGDHSFIVPPGVRRICVEVWGPGGRNGGGGGGYGYQCFSVTEGAVFALRVGGGNSGSSDSTSFGGLIVARGGTQGTFQSPGIGGTATGMYVMTGSNGATTGCNQSGYINGGRGANGGQGGKIWSNGAGGCNISGPDVPGGGGWGYNTPNMGGINSPGANGQIKIFW